MLLLKINKFLIGDAFLVLVIIITDTANRRHQVQQRRSSNKVEPKAYKEVSVETCFANLRVLSFSLKGQAILFFILHPFFVGQTEDREVIFILCKTPPFTVKDLTVI